MRTHHPHPEGQRHDNMICAVSCHNMRHDIMAHSSLPGRPCRCYNANSGDTGGLVDDSWMNLEWVKLRYLRDQLGLTPWYEAS
jgi:hypothetical protein